MAKYELRKKHAGAIDHRCMSRALALAERGLGRVEPNPMVGCVIVRNGRVVGEGFHRRFGGPHAEIEAIRAAGSAARGATAYISMEPCNHFGKTPPCTDALLKAGIHRVIAAMKDPNPLVSGKGFQKLRSAGIRVHVGLREDEARRLNAAFITFQVEHRPYVILKWAQSLDGKIASYTGDSKWISSPESRKSVHGLRGISDGIVVGIHTVLVDDPNLTARHTRPARIAARIVLDPNLRIPQGARLVKTARRIPTLIVSVPGASRRRRAALLRAGCEVLEIPKRGRGIHLDRLAKVLWSRGMTRLLVEGGGTTIGSFLDAGLADEARIYVAPILIGGETAPGPLRHRGPAILQERASCKLRSIEPFGGDLCYTVTFRGP